MTNAYYVTGGFKLGHMARRLAMRLNCAGNERGNVLVGPCMKCKSCVETEVSMSLDVQECDAYAYSNDADFERLREGMNFGTYDSRFRIYITHHLGDWNSHHLAVVKDIMATAPPHIRFIFADYEPRVPIMKDLGAMFVEPKVVYAP